MSVFMSVCMSLSVSQSQGILVHRFIVFLKIILVERKLLASPLFWVYDFSGVKEKGFQTYMGCKRTPLTNLSTTFYPNFPIMKKPPTFTSVNNQNYEAKFFEGFWGNHPEIVFCWWVTTGVTTAFSPSPLPLFSFCS